MTGLVLGGTNATFANINLQRVSAEVLPVVLGDDAVREISATVESAPLPAEVRTLQQSSLALHDESMAAVKRYPDFALAQLREQRRDAITTAILFALALAASLALGRRDEPAASSDGAGRWGRIRWA